MNIRAILLIVGATLGVTVAENKKIICYWRSWSIYRRGDGAFDLSYVDPKLCTHMIYAFAGLSSNGKVKIVDPRIDLPKSSGKDNYNRFNKLREQNPALKTLIAIGGWNKGTGKYSKVVANPNLRRKMVKSIVAFVKKYNFDGLDFDWQYPVQGGLNNGSRPIDKQNFVLLMKELRERFDQEGLLLSAAVGAAERTASQSYNIPEISKYFHFINLMTYDLHDSWTGKTGIDAPLYAASFETADDAKLNVDAIIKYWLSNGAPAEKLVLGVSFYGRSFTLSNSKVNGVGATAWIGDVGSYMNIAGILGYNEICLKMKNDNWQMKYDEERKAVYAYGGNQWISFDNEKTLKEKVNYVKSYNLGGVMVWSIDTDDFHGNCGPKWPLLNVLYRELASDASSIPTQPSISKEKEITDPPHQPQEPQEPQEPPGCGNPQESQESHEPQLPQQPQVLPETQLPHHPHEPQKLQQPEYPQKSEESEVHHESSEPHDSQKPQQPQEVTPMSSKTLCRAEGYVRDPHNCSKFYHCRLTLIHSHYVYEALPYKCPDPLLYDTLLSKCNWPNKVACNTNVTLNPHQPWSTMEETETEPTQPPQHPQQPQQPQQPMQPQQPPKLHEPQEPQLPEQPQKPDGSPEPQQSEQPEVTQKPGESNESQQPQQSQECEEPEESQETHEPQKPQLDEHPQKPKEPEVHHESSEPHDSHKPQHSQEKTPESNGKLCRAEGYVGDPQDCSKFYYCRLSLIHSRYVYEALPHKCPDPLLYDKSLSKCNWPNKVECNNGVSPNPTEPWSTTEETITEPTKPPQHPQKPQQPMQPQQPQQPPKPHKPQEPPQSEHPGEPKKPKVHQESAQEQQPQVEIPMSSKTLCRAEGYVRDPHNCSKFYYCRLSPIHSHYVYEALPYNCPDPLLYDTLLSKCDLPNKVACNTNVTLNPHQPWNTMEETGTEPTQPPQHPQQPQKPQQPMQPQQPPKLHEPQEPQLPEQPQKPDESPEPQQSEQPEVTQNLGESNESQQPQQSPECEEPQESQETHEPHKPQQPEHPQKPKEPEVHHESSEPHDSHKPHHSQEETPESNGKLCRAEGYLRDPQDCSKFYYCRLALIHSRYVYEAQPYKCPDPLLYDTSLSMCNWPDKVECNNGVSPNSTEPWSTTEETMTEPAKPPQHPQQPQKPQQPMQPQQPQQPQNPPQLEHPQKPKQPEVHHESSEPHDSHKPQQSHEETPTSSGTLCQAEGYLRDPQDCSKYYYCRLALIHSRFVYEAQPYKCPDPLLYDTSLSKCNWPDKVECNNGVHPNSTEPWSTTEETMTEPTKPLQHPQQPQKPQQPMQPHQPQQSPTPQQPEHPQKPKEPELHHESSEPHDSHKPQHSQEETPTSSGTLCQAEGYVRDPQDCSKFYYCRLSLIHSRYVYEALPYNCPAPLLYDTSLSKCNWPDKVECNNGVHPNSTEPWSTTEETMTEPTQPPQHPQQPQKPQQPMQPHQPQQPPKPQQPEHPQKPKEPELHHESSEPHDSHKPQQSHEETPTSSRTLCQAEGYLRDPQDCSKFYYCRLALIHSRYVYEAQPYKCPDPLLYDTSLSKCNWPDKVECNNGVHPNSTEPWSTTEETMTEPTQPPQHPQQPQKPQQPMQPHQPQQPPKPQQPEHPQKPKEPELHHESSEPHDSHKPQHSQEETPTSSGTLCQAEGYVRDPQDCSKFYYCRLSLIHSRYVYEALPYNCPAPLLYDTSLFVCNWPNKVQCDSSVSSNQWDTKGGAITELTHQPQSPHQHQKLEQPMQPHQPQQPLEPHKPQETPQPEYPEEPKEPKVQHELPQAQQPQKETPTSSGTLCQAEGYVRDPQDCSKFYYCRLSLIHSRYVYEALPYNCPAPLLYDTSLSKCNWPNKVECNNGVSPNPTEPWSTTEETITEPTKPPQHPQQPQKPQQPMQPQQPQQPQNPPQLEHPEEPKEPKVHHESPQAQQPQKETPTSSGTLCQAEGYVRDPQDCSKFYYCRLSLIHSRYVYEALPYNCPAPLLYDTSLFVCNWPNKVQCDTSVTSNQWDTKGGAITEPTHQSQSPQQHQKLEQPMQPQQPKVPQQPKRPTNSRTLCQAEGYVRDPHNCSKFYYCRFFNNVYEAQPFDCPAPLMYDTKLGVCNWPVNVQC